MPQQRRRARPQARQLEVTATYATQYLRHSRRSCNGPQLSAWKTVSEATILAAAVQERSCTTCGTTQRQNAGSALSPKLTLNATSITLKTKQKTKKIQTGLAAGDAVDSWISSDEKVVKVSGTASGTCTITAQKKTGNATIYVKLKSGLTGTIQVKVQKKRVAATKVVVAEKTVKAEGGQKQKDHAYIQPLTTEDKLTLHLFHRRGDRLKDERSPRRRPEKEHHRKSRKEKSDGKSDRTGSGPDRQSMEYRRQRH